MFAYSKKTIITEAIFYERLRTLLYISMFKNIKIWIVLLQADKTLDSARLASGIIEGVVNGTEPEPFHKKYIGGRCYFKNSKEPFNMAEIVAVSFNPITDVHEPYNGTRIDILNRTQHLIPFTGFSSGTNTEKHYFNLLSGL